MTAFYVEQLCLFNKCFKWQCDTGQILLYTVESYPMFL